MSVRWPLGVLLVVCAACASTHSTPEHEEDVHAAKPWTSSQVVQLIPAQVKERTGWGQDVHDVLLELGQPVNATTVCSVLAIIEQESGFNADPAVPGLAKVIQTRLDAYAGKLGPLGRPALDAVLDGHAPGNRRSFRERLKTVKTERDVDVIFRELLAWYSEKYPRAVAMADVFGGLFKGTHLEDLNPVTTAGSMQVSVRFASELGEKRGLTNAQVRDQLYTRRGGVYFGTARLLGYEAAYTAPVHRFADYNAGMYASRNSALQMQVAELTGRTVTADGDLMAYARDGSPTDTVTQSLKAIMAWRTRYAPQLSEGHVRDDVFFEKRQELEDTATWRAIKDSYKKRTGKAAPYARVPDVVISSPKMSHDRSTNWYARNVTTRFEACIKRAKGRGVA